MLLDIRTIQRNGQTVIQKFCPIGPSSVDSDGYMNFSLNDCEWQDVLTLNNIATIDDNPGVIQ